MNTPRFVVVLVVLGALLIGAYQSVYVVREYDQVVITQFGKIQGKAVTAAGLHFKVPFVQIVHRFDKRWLEWDGDRNEIPTRDKKYIWVDTYGRWRISDPIRFYKRLRDERGAQSRLDDIIDGEIRNVIANHDLIEIVRSSGRKFLQDEDAEDANDEGENELLPSLGRQKLMAIVQKKASAVTPGYGVELADIRIKRINYISTVQQKVFERMISERKRIAERYRSEGQGKSAEIRGKIEKDLKTIESVAYRKAAEIRGKADAEATSIYASAYNRDPGLYKFLRTLETYRDIIDDKTDVVLSSDAELWQYLKSQ